MGGGRERWSRLSFVILFVELAREKRSSMTPISEYVSRSEVALESRSLRRFCHRLLLIRRKKERKRETVIHTAVERTKGWVGKAGGCIRDAGASQSHPSRASQARSVTGSHCVSRISTRERLHSWFLTSINESAVRSSELAS